MSSLKILFPSIKKEYLLDEVLNNNPFKDDRYEYEIIQFIQDWVRGQSEFSLSTSGSTGTPKSIAVTRNQMSNSAQFTAQALNLEKGDQALVCLNTAYIAGKMMLVRCLEIGMDIILVPPTSNPFQFLTDANTIDFAAMVPLQIHTLLADETSKKQLERIKSIIIGGGPVSPELENKLQAFSSAIYHTYGMTETVSHIALRKLNGPNRTDFYKAFDEVHLSVDERGCLMINSILTNYQKLYTNDVVALLNENCFVWKGRYDNVINSGGIKVHPEQLEQKIEQILLSHQIEVNFFIIGVPDNILGQKVCMVVESIQNKLIHLVGLKETLKNYLSKYEMPKEIFFSNNFLYTETGKIRRKDTLLALKSSK